MNKDVWFRVVVAVLIGALGVILYVAVANAAEGMATWYGPGFHGNKTASGQRFDQMGNTCATPSYRAGQKPYWVTVRYGKKSVRCLVNDRMGSHGPIIDVSKGVAIKLGMLKAGRVRVTVTR